jgi:UDP:flavonoid glycosyltransferase YjiC (YdhE family)
MSRILLAWELGLNLGHLTRLLPLALRLREKGHTVAVAARNLGTASEVLGPAAISFVQAPYLAESDPLPHRAAGYSDILRAYGWGGPSTLRVLTQGWFNLFHSFRPEIVVADFSPTAVLAARMRDIPFLLVGNGFEIPPATIPLPPFPGFALAISRHAAESEQLVVRNANVVARALGGRPLEALAEIVYPERALLATYPELDHYGERLDTRYIGPLLGELQLPTVAWPGGAPRGIFVCVRPNTVSAGAILGALSQIEAPVVCVAVGFTAGSLRRFGACNIRFESQPVALAQIAPTADLCVSYGAEGTMMTFLRAGTPIVLSPGHVEAKLSARRLKALGVGTVLPPRLTVEAAATSVTAAIRSPVLHQAAADFAARCATRQLESAVTTTAQVIDRMVRQLPPAE